MKYLIIIMRRPSRHIILRFSELIVGQDDAQLKLCVGLGRHNIIIFSYSPLCVEHCPRKSILRKFCMGWPMGMTFTLSRHKCMACKIKAYRNEQ